MQLWKKTISWCKTPFQSDTLTSRVHLHRLFFFCTVALLGLHECFPKVCAKFSQQRPSACSYAGLSTLCLNACYRGPWRAKLCRARGTALRALRALKRSKSPQQISDWTSSVQSSTNENGTLPNGESTWDPSAWQVSLSRLDTFCDFCGEHGWQLLALLWDPCYFTIASRTVCKVLTAATFFMADYKTQHCVIELLLLLCNTKRGSYCTEKTKSSHKTNGCTMIMFPCKILRMRTRRFQTAKHLRSCILTH